VRIPALVRLLRPALAPTAAADVLAGAAFLGGASAGSTALAVTGAICIYTGGMAQNDLCDRERDETLHPERPLVTQPRLVKPVRFLVLGLYLVGVAISGAPWPALAAAVLANAYNLGLKHRFPFDVIAVGGARAANLMIGFTIAAGPMSGAAWIYATAYFFWIAAITTSSRCEDLRPVQTRRLGLLLALPLKLAALFALACLALDWSRAAVFFVPAALLTFFFVRAFHAGTRVAVMGYVLRCLQLIFVVHAATLWAHGDTQAVIPQLVCAALSFFLLGALAPKKKS